MLRDVMADASDAFEEAVRWRASGIGLVPIGVIRQLTPEEWGKVRLLGQTEAQLLAALRDAEPSVEVDYSKEVDREP